MVEAICDYCIKEIWITPRRFKKYKHHFCNMQCFAKWKKEKYLGANNPRWNSKPVLCNSCGKTVFVKKSKINNKRHFCDENCYFEWIKQNPPSGKNNPNWRSIETTCDFCEGKIYVTPYRLKKSKLHFCNKKCFDDWERINKPRGENSPVWTGGKFPYYGYCWSKQKRKVTKRAGYVSEVSGNNGGILDVHHIFPIRLFVQKYIDLCLKGIPLITTNSFKILPYELFIPNILFEEINSKSNLICLTREEHPMFEGMPPTFFEAIRVANKQ